MSIGINGFGRIGKCIFLQLIEDPLLHVNAINAPDFDIQKIDSYLKHDSVHHYDKRFQVEVIDDNTFTVNGNKIHIFRNRDAKQLNWREYGVNHIVDATGVYLTEEKARQHDVDYLIMSAPAKDDTPIFVPGANLETYNGEHIVSGASCTTNSITPVLRHLDAHYGIDNANFTTIHSSTASQKVVDTAHSKSRTERSIFNNIIPHTTGASAAISKVLPTLYGKITGTSIRVPTNNVSLVDINVELRDTVDIETILTTMEQDTAIQIVRENLVSSDFVSTECPSIVDRSAAMHLGGNRFKFMVWYDNEWSYASQMIKIAHRMMNFSKKDRFFIEDHNFKGKRVILRLDLNVPTTDGLVTDDFRVSSTIPTINRILSDEPKSLVILSHMGRPKGRDEQFSLQKVLPILESHLEKNVHFLPDGVSTSSIEELERGEHQIYLLENMRFHEEETKYAAMDASTNDVIQMIQQLGDVYVNDAFGCVHRDHLSIRGIQCDQRAYGYLIQKELLALNSITQNTAERKILAIVGGGKMDDKLELLKNLCKKVDTIYIAGGNINSLLKNDMTEYLTEIGSHKAKIILMTDGLCASNLDDIPKHMSTDMADSHENFFDIGIESFSNLHRLISEHDIVFWNGTLGVVEDAKYKKGSDLLVKTLMREMQLSQMKQVIVGGGDTGGFVNKYDHGFTHISTGGGAAIEYITFDTLVGLDIFK